MRTAARSARLWCPNGEFSARLLAFWPVLGPVPIHKEHDRHAVIPRIISICNLKGGAGKSTIAVNLACALRARTGVDCILVDADRQATALTWAENGELGIRVTSRVLHEAKPDDAHPGLMWVTQIRILADKNPSVIIDLPPGLEYSLAAVAAISDLIFVPVNPSGVDFHSTARFIKLVQKTREIRGSDKPACVIVPNRLDRRMTIARKLSLYEQFGEPIAPPIGMRSAFVYAFDQGRWVGDIAPQSAAHREVEQLVSVIVGEADSACADAAAPTAAGGAAGKARRGSRRKGAAAATSKTDVVAESGAAERAPENEHDGNDRIGHVVDEPTPERPAEGHSDAGAGDPGADHQPDGECAGEPAAGGADDHGRAESDDEDREEAWLGDEADRHPVETHAGRVGEDRLDQEQAADPTRFERDDGGHGGAEDAEHTAGPGEDAAEGDEERNDDRGFGGTGPGFINLAQPMARS